MGDTETEVGRLGGEFDQQIRALRPFIAAYPNPIVLRPVQAHVTKPNTGTSVLSWWLQSVSRADLYAYPPGGGEKFLGTKRSDGSVRSEPITVGQTYRWKLFPVGNKTTPYDEVAVTAREFDLSVGAGPMGRFENVFFPTNLVSRAQWYHHTHEGFILTPGGLVPSGGLLTAGLVRVDREPTPNEVLVGYIHQHDTAGWFGADWEQFDLFWRGGVQFDAAAVQAYIQRWGMLAATLKFRVRQDDSSCLARIEQAAQDMTDWEPIADGVIPGDDTIFVDLPVGPLYRSRTSHYEIRPGGVFFVNVGVIAYRWSSFSDLPHAFVLIGPDERWVQDDTSTFMNHYSDFVLEITPSPFR
jgi:hypothetical protein